MKKFTSIAAALIFTVLCGTVSAQTSGVLWIKTFEPGSTSLNGPRIDKDALAALDYLMQDEEIEVTFLGAADSVAWYMNGKSVHTHIGEAWNDAKRLSRARALRARYQRGNVGVTHENIAGVKVVWKKRPVEDYSHELTDIRRQNEHLNQKIAELEGNIEKLKPIAATNGTNGSNGMHGYVIKQKESSFDWFLQGGFWTWQSATGENLTSPSIALGIIIDKTSFILQGGVTPWHISTKEGNQAESFVYLGIKHMKTSSFGFSAGAFRGWEFFTETDNWTYKTTGLSSGVVLKYSIFEINPSITYSSSNSIYGDNDWKVGTTLGLSVNFNEAF